MSILDNAKDVAKAIHEINNLELYQRVLNLRSDIIDLVEDNKRLRDENELLTQKLDKRAKLTFRTPFYFLEGDNTPHCPACWEKHRDVIHVVKMWEDEQMGWDCPTCKNHYVVDSHRSAPGPIWTSIP